MKAFKQINKSKFSAQNRKTIGQMIITSDAFGKFILAINEKYDFEDDERKTFENLSKHLQANNVVLRKMLEQSK